MGGQESLDDFQEGDRTPTFLRDQWCRIGLAAVGRYGSGIRSREAIGSKACGPPLVCLCSERDHYEQVDANNRGRQL